MHAFFPRRFVGLHEAVYDAFGRFNGCVFVVVLKNMMGRIREGMTFKVNAFLFKQLEGGFDSRSIHGFCSEKVDRMPCSY